MTYPTVSQMFDKITKDHKNRELYFSKNKGLWEGISGIEIRSTVEDIAFALQSLEIGKGCNVALLSNNSPRWAMSDYGIICSGAATVCAAAQGHWLLAATGCGPCPCAAAALVPC